MEEIFFVITFFRKLIVYLVSKKITKMIIVPETDDTFLSDYC